MGIKYNTETVQNLLKSAVGPSDSALVLVDKDSPVLTGTDNINDEKALKPSVESNKTGAEPPAIKEKRTETIKDRPAAKKKTRSTPRQPIGFAYPHQNLKEYGTLSVKTNAPATIFIDKIEYGKSNGPPIKLSLGRHFIEVVADGYRRMTRRIFTEKDKQMDIEVNLIAE